jgi:hypothetical protein
MTEQKFKFEMHRAETMRGLADPMMAEYWAGYIRGLRRAYHGEKFGTAEEHEKWLSAANSRDESRKQRGRGYKDGLTFKKVSGRIGRPPVGDTMLDKLTVPSALKSALKAKAEELGLSMPDVRREAYRKFTE